MLTFPKDRPLDVICIGRANVDLYTMEQGVSLRESKGFLKHVGGSPANIATALARLGAKAALISKVSDDQLGHFVRDTLAREQVDIRYVHVDHTGTTRTSIAFAEVKPDNCDVLFYRKQAADLFIQAEDIQEDFIASAKAILISGTALSAEPSRSAIFQAISCARLNGTRVMLDLDFRLSAWNNPEEVSSIYERAALGADMIIGNQEEFQCMDPAFELGEKEELIQKFLSNQSTVIIVKNGAKGGQAYDKTGNVYPMGVFPVKVLKPYGAGDAFAGSLCYGLIQEEELATCLRRASAAGAIVVSKETCTDAMPTLREVDEFLHNNREKYIS